MKHKKIFKRENGLRISVEVSLFVDSFRQEYQYSTYVSVASPRKRIFRPPANEHEGATKNEIYETAMELYFKLKPRLESEPEIKDIKQLISK